MKGLLHSTGHVIYVIFDAVAYFLGKISLPIGAVAVSLFFGYTAYLIASLFLAHSTATVIGVIVFVPVGLLTLTGVAKITSGDWRY